AGASSTRCAAASSAPWSRSARDASRRMPSPRCWRVATAAAPACTRPPTGSHCGRSTTPPDRLQIHRRKMLLKTRVADPVAEFRVTVPLDVGLQLMPATLLVADVLAVSAGRQDAAQRLHLVEGGLQRMDQVGIFRL